MSEKPNAGDAEIIMRLYDLRRETEMRKARAWYAASFWPTSADDVIQVINVANPQENAWFRQVSGYWEMAASFVLRGELGKGVCYVDVDGERPLFRGRLGRRLGDGP